jgi:hypothetical protein
LTEAEQLIFISSVVDTVRILEDFVRRAGQLESFFFTILSEWLTSRITPVVLMRKAPASLGAADARGRLASHVVVTVPRANGVQSFFYVAKRGVD